MNLRIIRWIKSELLLGFILLFSLSNTDRAFASDTIRIMPLGNSITKDFRSQDSVTNRSEEEMKSYRYPLYQLLDGMSGNFDFVGSEYSGYKYFDDAEHAGFQGFLISDLLYLLKTGYNLKTDSQITVGPYLDAYMPDIILLHIGTNNVTIGNYQNLTDFNNLLDEIDKYETRTGKNAMVFMATIINNQYYECGYNSATTTFNNNLKQLAQQRIIGGDRITLVDMECGAEIDYSLDMFDKYHPNETGYQKMANKWWKHISAYLQNDFCPEGIVHYWKFDDEADPFLDSKTNLSASCDGCTPILEDGMINSAAKLNGTDSYVDFNDLSKISWAANESFSIELWMRTNNNSGENRVMVGRDDPDSQLHWWIGMFYNNKVIFQLIDNQGNGNYIGNNGPDLNDNLWHHIIAVRNSENNVNKVYVDGFLVDSLVMEYLSDFSGNCNLNIGYLNLDNGYGYEGNLDNLVFYSRALSAEEVLVHYETGSSFMNYCESSGTTNTRPVVFSEEYDTPSGIPINIDLKAFDAEFDSLIFNITQNPLYGDIVQTGNTVIYTPVIGFSGIDSFKFVAVDKEFESDPGTIVVNVTGGTGSTMIYVNAYGTQAVGEFAHFDLYINQNKIQSISTTGEAAIYQFETEYAREYIKEITLYFDNDIGVGGTSRQLYINWIRVGSELFYVEGEDVIYDVGDRDGVGIIDAVSPMIWAGYMIFDVSGAGSPLPLPNPPQNFKVDSVSTSQIFISWEFPDQNINGICIERLISGQTSFLPLDCVDYPQSNYTNSQLMDNTEYYYRSRTFNDFGYSAYSNIVRAYTKILETQIPSAPSDLSGQIIDDGQIILSWIDNSSNENGFELFRAEQPDSMYTRVKDYAADRIEDTIFNLTTDREYYFKIRAYNDFGTSTFSNVLSIVAKPGDTSIISDIFADSVFTNINCPVTFTPRFAGITFENSDINITEETVHGTITLDDSVFTYVPMYDFVGEDSLRFEFSYKGNEEIYIAVVKIFINEGASIIVEARSSILNDEFGVFRLYVNKTIKGEITTTGEFQQYTFNIEETRNEVKEVGINFTNDESNNEGDRDLYVKNIRVVQDLIPANEDYCVYDLGSYDGKEILSGREKIQWIGTLVFNVPPNNNVVKDPNSGISDFAYDEEVSISVFPNPFRHKLFIQLTLEHPTSIEMDIYDISGRYVKHLCNEKLPTGKYLYYWDINEQISAASGIYFLKIKTTDKIYRIKTIHSGY